MPRWKVVLVAVLVLGFAAAVVSSTMGGDGAQAVHTMPDGSTMPAEQMDR